MTNHLRINYKGEIIMVEIIQADPSDPDMPYLVWFPVHHEMYLPAGVWLSVRDYTVVDGGE